MVLTGTQTARFSIVVIDAAGGEVNAGVLLLDPSADRLYTRLRRDWFEISPAEADVLVELEEDLVAKARDLGASRLLEALEQTCSNAVRITDPREIEVRDFDRVLARLYREHVRSTVLPFETHLPRYSLAAAAGKFLENSEIREEGWEEAPPDLPIAENMFVARISGKSMEPNIPDGSLCIFRYGVAGSRQGRLVLVEAIGTNDRYTVKRYRSEKKETSDGWRHERIILEPLNPEFESWELDPEEERFRVIAEYLCVL